MQNEPTRTAAPASLLALADALDKGASADIFYDAESYGDPAKAECIKATMQAMCDAAVILRNTANGGCETLMPLASPDWDEVMIYFGLDSSFCWTQKHIEDYTKQYLDCFKVSKACERLTARAVSIVTRIAALKKWGEKDEQGHPYQPSDGYEDSHLCLMNLIDNARSCC